MKLYLSALLLATLLLCSGWDANSPTVHIYASKRARGWEHCLSSRELHGWSKMRRLAGRWNVSAINGHVLQRGENGAQNALPSLRWRMHGQLQSASPAIGRGLSDWQSLLHVSLTEPQKEAKKGHSIHRVNRTTLIQAISFTISCAATLLSDATVQYQTDTARICCW